MSTDDSFLMEALAVVTACQWHGVTYKELLDSPAFEDKGHGSASAVLTRLHQSGLIRRLAEKRDRCSVYVRPAYLDGRDEVPARSYSRERGEDVRDDVAWATLGRIASCTCPCTCGARDQVAAETASGARGGGDIQAATELSEEEQRLLLEAG